MNTTGFKELQLGAVLQNGKYIIERTIGAGGFGITYYARHSSLDSGCAIKEFFINGYCVRNTFDKTVSLSGMDADMYEKYRQKFIEEAQTLARLDHPNIVKVTDVFLENNTAYMVMPFVSGLTLQQTVAQRGRLNCETAVNCIAQIAEATGYIHARDILHRDIKPDNIIITPDNRAVLIDFGSAREFVHDKTQHHTAILTQGYAPPEQYSSDSRKGAYSDVYSLGAVFYFALTGVKPMDAAVRSMETMPEPKMLCPDIPVAANSAIMKAMQPRPENRYQTTEKFMTDLLNAGSSEHTEIRREIRDKNEYEAKPQRRKGTKTFVTIVSVMVILCAVFVVFVIPEYRKRNIERAEKERIALEEKRKQETAEKTERMFEMVKVAGGTFTMGCTAEQGADCFDYEKPAHQVTLDDFYIGKYEVTQAQWTAVMGNNPSRFKGDNLPVESVSWYDIQEFIGKLNQITGKRYRLPTEAEWEYAARGGAQSRGYKYSGSNNADEVAWYDDNSDRKPHPAGTKRPNELGIYDMSGSVWEWCNDRRGAYRSARQINPVGAESGTSRVGRGGGWAGSMRRVRVSYRDLGAPNLRGSCLGFRLAKQ
jgi:formylglycine-generating enzyme required for sulfatase activity/tRNA A-37 threonylcarbamoyl transferase component Bud32